MVRAVILSIPFCATLEPRAKPRSQEFDVKCLSNCSVFILPKKMQQSEVYFQQIPRAQTKLKHARWRMPKSQSILHLAKTNSFAMRSPPMLRYSTSIFMQIFTEDLLDLRPQLPFRLKHPS